MNTFKIKKTTTRPPLAVTLQYSNGSAIDLTNGSIWFRMGDISNYSFYYSGTCEITEATTGNCEYRWNGSDTGSVGNWWGEFLVDWGAGSTMILPNDHSLKIEVYEDYV